MLNLIEKDLEEALGPNPQRLKATHYHAFAKGVKDRSGRVPESAVYAAIDRRKEAVIREEASCKMVGAADKSDCITKAALLDSLKPFVRIVYKIKEMEAAVAKAEAASVAAKDAVLDKEKALEKAKETLRDAEGADEEAREAALAKKEELDAYENLLLAMDYGNFTPEQAKMLQAATDEYAK